MTETVDPRELPLVLDACEARIGYRFANRELLARCLTHASVSRTRLDSNERLEFLGDAILGAVVCDLLYSRYPEEAEGELTRIKSVVVSRYTCADISDELQLSQFLQRGKGLGEDAEIPVSVLAAVFESLIAAIYLDRGWETVYEFSAKLLDPHIDAVVDAAHGKNFKSELQQLIQKQQGLTPCYTLVDERGPDHNKCFKVSALIGGAAYAPAWGSTKKEAEQKAAENALAELAGIERPHASDEIA